MIPLFEKKEVKTPRLTVSYLEAGDPSKDLMVLVHGNTSSNLFYLSTMKALEKDFHIVAPDLRGYGYTEKLPIDATGGLRVWSEDLRGFFQTLNLEKPHLVGWSMGGGVVMQYALDYPQDVRSIGLINPLSPFGYSGTKDLDGTPNNANFSGSGGGTVNRDFVENLKNKVRDKALPTAAPSVLKSYFAPGYEIDPEWEEVYLDSMFLMGIGEDFYPGDFVAVPEWPNVGPGTRGIGNAMSPKYVNLSGLADLPVKPPVIWYRGAFDAIVSDTCYLDIGYLGKLGYVPGWRGDEAFPPHTMVSQTRHLLEKYRENGGVFVETVYEKSGHGPHIEEEAKFAEDLKAFIASTMVSGKR